MFTRVWKHVVQKGDAVIDATCGNGYDTLAMVKMVADESARGCVFAMDIQNDALENIRMMQHHGSGWFTFFFYFFLLIMINYVFFYT